jgi:hypothetical protein
MSDHEFEKQIHQKLQELKLRPSDGVWMEVEKSIRQGKNRRRFMWWWMAALFVCVTAGGYILYNHTAQTHPVNAEVAQASAASLSNTKPAETSTNSTKQTTTLEHQVTDNTIADKNITGEEKASTSSPLPTSPQQPNMASPVITPEASDNKQPVIAAAGTTTNKNKKPVQQPHTYNTGNIDPVEPINTTKLTHEKQRRTNKKGVRQTLVIAKAPVQLRYHEASSETIATDKTIQSEPNALNSTMPARVNELDSAIATTKATTTPLNNRLLPFLLPDSLSKTAVAQPIQRKKPSLWHWGVVADAGYSRIAESKLFQLKGLLGEKYYAEDLSARSSATPSPNNSTTAFNGTANNQLVNWSAYTAPPKKASPIQADVSFSVGLFVQRTLSPRLKVSLGLEYSYISVHTQVGQKVNATNNPLVVNMGTSQAALVKEYYKYPGTDTAQSISGAAYSQGMAYSQKYTYRFHYLEIPLTASWQINKGRRLPPFQLEGGISMARLLSVDALHYEGIKGVYYKDNDLFNKTQFNFVAGLSVGLLQQSKHPLWIGPNLRYALNGLVNKEVSTGQYTWSTGISVKMLLGKL